MSLTSSHSGIFCCLWTAVFADCMVENPTAALVAGRYRFFLEKTSPLIMKEMHSSTQLKKILYPIMPFYDREKKFRSQLEQLLGETKYDVHLKVSGWVGTLHILYDRFSLTVVVLCAEARQQQLLVAALFV